MHPILHCGWKLTALVFIPVASLVAQPVVHLKFDNVANLGEDSSGQTRHGISQGVGFRTNGVVGGAAVFDGTNRLTLNGDVSAVLAGDFTVSLWVQTTGEQEMELFALQEDGVGPKLKLKGNRAGWDDGERPADLTSNSAVNTGSFVHVVISRNLATGNESIFVNGALEATRNNGNGNAFTVQGMLALGGVPGRGFVGAIDDFQLYNRAFNASEVALLHANPGSAVGVLAVPEPSTYALLATGFLMLVAARRRA